MYLQFCRNLSLRRRCLKLWHLPAGGLLIVLLWAMYVQLSSWDGIVEPPLLGNFVDADQVEAYNRLWLQYGYNAWLAKQIPLQRELPDMRDERCLNYSHATAVHTSTIIVIFRNEQLAMLLRTLHSIRDRTDMSLIAELLLVNDNSDAEFWLEELSRQAFDAYVSHYIHPFVRTFHFPEQVGVVRARRFAANEAKTETLVFLDAHVEVTDGWLEPLLIVIQNDPCTLAMPQLDRLDEHTLDYIRIVERRNLFDWSLRRREVPLLWQQLMRLPQPFEQPVVRTSAFVIRRQWFADMVNLDLQLNAQPAAELELSLIVWRLGCRVLQVPCSRVGHLQPKDSSYITRYGSLDELGVQHLRSNKRLTELWLNEPKYKSMVYEYQPQIQQAHIGNLSSLQKLLATINHESFDWYLDNVATDLLQHFPLRPRADFAHGTLRPAQLPDHCLTGHFATNRITLEPCERADKSAQNWTLSYMNDLRLGVHNCAEIQPDRTLALNVCHTLGGPQNWYFDLEFNALVSNADCLEFNARMKLVVRTCNYMNANQIWFFEHTNLEAFQAKLSRP